MNLEQTVAYHKRLIKNKNTINKLCKLIKGQTVEITDKEEAEFRNNLPLQLDEFFEDCLLKARKYLLENDVNLFTRLDYMFIIVLMYFVLYKTELEEKGGNIRLFINISSLFFTLNSIPNSDDKIFFDDMYLQTIKVLDYIRTVNYRDAPAAMYFNDLRNFLIHSKSIPNQDSVTQTISFLAVFFVREDSPVFVNFSFECEQKHGDKLAFLAFKCYETILMKEFDSKVNTINARLTVLFSLLNCYKTNTASTKVLSTFQKNVNNFIQHVSPLLIIDEEHLLLKAVQVIISKEEYDCYDGISLILKILPADQYQSYIQWMACNMISENSNHKKHIQNLAVLVIKNPPDLTCFSKWEVCVEILTQNLMKLMIDSCDETRDNAIKNLSELLKLNDAYVKIVIRRILGRDEQLHNLNVKSILIVLKKNSDLTWKEVSLNQRIINILCQFIILREDYFLTQQTMEVLLSLCLTANPHHLKPCLNSLKILIEANLGITDNVAKAIINVFLHQLSKDKTSFFTKELWSLMFGESKTKKIKKKEKWNIINLLIAHSSDCDKVLDKFHEEKLLNCDLVQSIINDLHKQEAAWKLLLLLCKYVTFRDWYKIEPYVTQTITAKLYTETTVYKFQCLIKMLENKRVNSEQEKTSLIRILTLLCNDLITFAFPINCLAASLELISIISILTATFPDWIVDASTVLNLSLSTSLRLIVNRTLGFITEIERSIAYASEMISFTRNYSVSEENLNHLKIIVDPHLQDQEFREILGRNSLVKTRSLILYSKLMFNQGPNQDVVVSELEKNLLHSDCNVILPALYALYDLCHVYLHYFDPLIPHLLYLIRHNNASIRLASVKIVMEFIDEGVIQLKGSHFLLFISLIIDSDEAIKKTVSKYMKKNFFVSHEKCVAHNFSSSIFHFNYYHDHPMLYEKLSPEDIRILEEHQYSKSQLIHLFNFLFQNVSKRSKFCIVEQLTKGVLVPALTNHEDYCSRAEKIRVFEHTLLLIIKLALTTENITTLDTKEFYEEQISSKFKRLLTPITKSNQKYKDYREIIKLVLKTLLKLVEKIERVYTCILEFVFRTVVIFTRGFFDDIQRIIYEDKSMRDLVESFLEMYKKESDVFKYEQKYVPEDMELVYAIDL